MLSESSWLEKSPIDRVNAPRGACRVKTCSLECLFRNTLGRLQRIFIEPRAGKGTVSLMPKVLKLHGDLAALELQKAAKKCLTTIFRKLKKVVFLAEDDGINQIFPQKCVSGGRLWMTIGFFRKIRENGAANLGLSG